MAEVLRNPGFRSLAVWAVLGLGLQSSKRKQSRGLGVHATLGVYSALWQTRSPSQFRFASVKGSFKGSTIATLRSYCKLSHTLVFSVGFLKTGFIRGYQNGGYDEGFAQGP